VRQDGEELLAKSRLHQDVPRAGLDAGLVDGGMQRVPLRRAERHVVLENFDQHLPQQGIFLHHVRQPEMRHSQALAPVLLGDAAALGGGAPRVLGGERLRKLSQDGGKRVDEDGMFLSRRGRDLLAHAFLPARKNPLPAGQQPIGRSGCRH